MVSRATKHIWKVALGLALSPAIGGFGLAHGQMANPAPAKPAVKGASALPPGSMGNNVETCRQLVREGRTALQTGDKVKAEKLARQAAAMKVTLPYWETDTPEKLLADIGGKTMPPPVYGRQLPADPRKVLKQGEDALKAGKIEDAQKFAQQAKSVPNVKWGLFETTPDKLLDEVQKARTARDQAESTKMLANARKLYEQGKYDDAEKMAYAAGRLHGAYGMWDFGDKPEKLVADIRTARDKSRKTKTPPAPSAVTAVAAKKPTTNAKPHLASGVQQASAPAPSWPTDVKTADVKGPTHGPTVTTAAGVTLPGAPNAVIPVTGQAAPGMPMPAPAPAIVNGSPLPVPAPIVTNMPAAPVISPAKTHAMQLMAEGKSCQMAGKFTEARAKYQEAQKCGYEFSPTEDSPDRCMMELSSVVVKQIDSAMRESGPLAESKLTSARQMAFSFGLDTRPIDSQLAAIKGAMQQTAATAQKVANDAVSVGQTILDRARLELRRGECEIARQLATEVHNGPYGLQTDAAQVMRSIDVEEHNQRVLAANRNYDAGMSAYRGKDYGQALAILQQVDATLLAPEKKTQIKDLMSNCAKADALAQKSNSSHVVTAAATGTQPDAVTPASTNGITGLQGAKPTMKAPAEGDSLAAQVQAMQEIEYQRLRAEGLEVQGRALQQWERGEMDTAFETLEVYLKKVKASKLDSQSVARLSRPIDNKLSSFKLMEAQKRFETGVVKSKQRFEEEKSKEFKAEEKKQRQVKDLMKQFNTLYKEGKYQEAEMAAAKAHELDPDDPATEAALQLAKIHGNLTGYDKIRKDRENLFVKAMDDAENVGPAVDQKNPLAFDQVRMKIANGRVHDKDGINVMRNVSEKDKEIQAKLAKPVQVNFHNVPLRQAIDDLRVMTNMNMHLESQSLSSEGQNPEQPVSLKADNISLKSALNVLLHQAHLTYIIQDEMLKITTEKAARGKLVQKVYSVADLVIPIDDYITPDHLNINKAMAGMMENNRVNLTGGGTPMTNNRNMLQNGQPIGTGTSGNTSSMSTAPNGQASMSTGMQPGTVGSSMSYVGNVSPTKQSMQDMLIKLITNTVAPQSWAEVGGAGTIDYMPIGMALVINQTPDVQEQVQDLLDALRRLQDLEVAVEVRIITLAETFFERVGLDFALNLKTDHNTRQYEPQLVTNNFKQAGQVNDFSPRNFLAGIKPGGIAGNSEQFGTFTSDLDIPIRSSSFQYAIPPFAYPNNPGFNGGLSMGLAFLNDIQVYMFMEAAQGDRRTNVMSAPKLTLFNGQTSTINVNDQQFFVTNVNVVGFGGQIVFVPINQPVPLGVSLAIQAVVSADRRFVRLNLAPTLSNLASATVPLFPVTTFITPVFEGGAQGQPIPFTQFIQQPQISSVQIQTTVSIPDGGTVILGGLKTLSEGRNEFGPPVLSKIPYVDRLFKNVGYGREAQSLLLMVTPRIIINSEEEEKQTGNVTSEAQAIRP